MKKNGRFSRWSCNSILPGALKQFLYFFVITATLLFHSCKSDLVSVHYDFNQLPDRIWIGEDFWTVPIEDWEVKDGKIMCKSDIQNATFSVLPYVLRDNQSDFRVSVDMGLLEQGFNEGSAGIGLGISDPEDDDVKAAIYFGRGIKLGVSTEGFAFLGHQVKELPEGFDLTGFSIEVEGTHTRGKLTIQMALFNDVGEKLLELSVQPDELVRGVVQLINNISTSDSRNNGPKFWFDNLSLNGKKFERRDDNRFGPVLWTMYTLSRGTLKLTAQLPPLGASDNKVAELQVYSNNTWSTVSSGSMDPDARTITFRVEAWDYKEAVSYRVSLPYIDSSGGMTNAYYEGTIQKEPEGRPLRMGALTCQIHYGFPYTPLVNNLDLLKPDLLYFSGDQLYEGNGGYGVRRSPEDVAIVNYLGKWYMFGWAFGDLMRNIPTICTPDDHDVYHGNLWGEEGVPFHNQEQINVTNAINTSSTTGFAQTVRFVNMVNRTQCEHLPDPYDPTPIEQGMSVWYTSLTYGRVSFAIVSDRIFKSGPERVSDWEGRADHLQEPLDDPTKIEKPDLALLGPRQEAFLSDWIQDWDDVDMKVLLTQTVFANVATHHGNYDGFLYGDLDSGGWPKKARDRALKLLRKASVFQIAGDQHLPSITQYGIEDYRDAGWCYVTPAIATGYPRWFRPDDLGIPAVNRPAHGLPNTEQYEDAFGNLNYVYAIGNPGNFSNVPERYQLAQDKTSGFGMIYFDSDEREITMESWRFLADVLSPGPDCQHPGWPVTISQYDNDGREAIAWLPTLKFEGEPNPVVEIINQDTGETEYIVRAKGTEFAPKVFSTDTFTIRVGYPEKGEWKLFRDIRPLQSMNEEEMIVKM